MHRNTQLVINSLSFSAYNATYSFIHGFDDIVNSLNRERCKGINNSGGKFVVGPILF